ncbi:MAG: hypothetical protein HC945_01510 [Nitrosarchaeum sp.]|nr:hypothetical protein [Nitrosarchaeum sp.]
MWIASCPAAMERYIAGDAALSLLYESFKAHREEIPVRGSLRVCSSCSSSQGQGSAPLEVRAGVLEEAHSLRWMVFAAEATSARTEAIFAVPIRTKNPGAEAASWCKRLHPFEAIVGWDAERGMYVPAGSPFEYAMGRELDAWKAMRTWREGTAVLYDAEGLPDLAQSLRAVLARVDPNDL